MEIDFFIVVIHIVGTIIGVGGATMIELHLNQSFKDKLVSADEKALLAIDYRVVRIGLILTIISGFAFLLLDNISDANEFSYNPMVWAKLFMVILIAINTLLLQSHAINLYWGSAISFVSWWMAALIGVTLANDVPVDFFGGEGSFFTTFSSLTLIYLCSVIIGAIMLNAFRNRNLSN